MLGKDLVWVFENHSAYRIEFKSVKPATKIKVNDDEFTFCLI